MCPPPIRMSNSIQIAENIQFLDEDRGRCLAPLLAGVLSSSANTRPANNPNSRKLARDGGEKVFAFSSPCGILPLAMNLRWTGRFIVDSERARVSAKSRYVTTQPPR